MSKKAILKVWKRSTYAGGTSFPDGTMGIIEKSKYWNLKDDEYVFTPDGKMYRMDQFIVNEQEIARL